MPRVTVSYITIMHSPKLYLDENKMFLYSSQCKVFIKSATACNVSFDCLYICSSSTQQDMHTVGFLTDLLRIQWIRDT